MALEAKARMNGTIGLHQLLIGIGLLFFASVLVESFRNTAGMTGSSLVAAFLLFGGLAVYIPAGYAVGKIRSSKWFAAGLAVVALIPRIVWILAIDSPPISDFLDMYMAAQQAAAGDFSFSSSPYFTRWVHQTGFTLYEALILALTGGSIVSLKVLNAVYQAATAVAVYRIGSWLFGEGCGRAAALTYASYVPLIMMCSVLTNQHLSTLLMALGCCFAVRHGGESRIGGIAAGSFFAFGHLIRPTGTFFLGIFVIYALLLAVDWEKGRIRIRLRPLVWQAAGACIAFMLIVQACNFALIRTGITDGPITANPEPYWKFMVGLNPETTGGWSWEDDRYALQFPLGEERNQAELERLRERLASKKDVLLLISRKWSAMWGGEDSAAMWSLGELELPQLAKRLAYAERAQYMATAALGAASMVLLLCRKGQGQHSMAGPGLAFVLMLLLGYAALHAIIEIQTRYRHDIMPYFVLMASIVFAARRKKGNGLL